MRPAAVEPSVSEPSFSAWHYQKDALPRFERSGCHLSLVLPIGFYGPEAGAPDIRVDWSTTGERGRITFPARVGDNGTLEQIDARLDGWRSRLYPETEQCADANDRKRVAQPPTAAQRTDALAALARRLTAPADGPTNRYFEATIPDLCPGQDIRYSITVTTAGRSQTLGPFVIVAATPTFTGADMIGGRCGGPTGTTWIGHVQTVGHLTHIRIDLDDLAVDFQALSGPSVIPIRIRAAGHWFDLDPTSVTARSASGRHSRLPIVDWGAGTVTLTVPDATDDHMIIDVGHQQVGVADAGGPGRTRLLISNFWIQQINDLLAEPFVGPSSNPYEPARTYTQVSMLDDHGTYSSRPVATAGQDGYLYGLEAHRATGIPCHLAVNVGILTLLNHDCPEDLAELRADVQRRLFEPAMAGFSSFRYDYFQAATNREDVQRGAALNRALLGRSGDVLMPDSRLYHRAPKTMPALLDPAVRYVVLDADTGYVDNEASIERATTADGLDLGRHFLWQDRVTGRYLLFIDDWLKDNALPVYSADELSQGRGDWVLGRPPTAVRRYLMSFALDPRRARNLLVYGDDFEHGCGNGWFEGSLGLHHSYAALLTWLDSHRTWMQTVTTADLDPGRDCVGTIDLRSSIDPKLDPGGFGSLDQFGNRLHMNTWAQQWSQTWAEWIGWKFGRITGVVERALIQWPGSARNELYETAWMAFLHGQNESMWSTQPEQGNPNQDPLGEPEDFTRVEGLQVRNVLVWLKASIWAAWAGTQASSPTFLDRGPVLDRIRDLEPIVGNSPDEHALLSDPEHVDGDPMRTWMLYNHRACVVIDANGGTATHAFVFDGGKARTISGTFNSYQYRDARGFDCDGQFLQNTIPTPNHQHVAADQWPGAQLPVIDCIQLRPGNGPEDSPVKRLLCNNYDEYERVKSPDSDELVLRPITANTSPKELTAGPLRSPCPPHRTEAQQQILDGLTEDGNRRRANENDRDRLVYHEWPGALTMTKTFRLIGSVLAVTYTHPPRDLVVANEFCVDLHRGVTTGARLTRTRNDDDRAEQSMMITMAGDSGSPTAGGHAIRLEAIENCEIDAISRLTHPPTGDPSGYAKYRALSRVLNETVVVRPTTDGSGFGYRIDLDHVGPAD